MSPRKKKNIVTVMAWPSLKTTHIYEGIVRSIEVDEEGHQFFCVTIENQHQKGRLHSAAQDLPARPGNAASLFLEACGFDAGTVGERIDLDQVIGVHLGMRFGDAEGSTIIFERLEKTSEESINPGGQS